jgi:hypothetical protein
MDSEDYHSVFLSLIPMWIMALYWFFYMLFFSHNDKLTGSQIYWRSGGATCYVVLPINPF